MRFVCPLCGEVYDEEVSGVPFADLPEEWRCPLCFAPKNSFVPQENTEDIEKDKKTAPVKADAVQG